MDDFISKQILGKTTYGIIPGSSTLVYIKAGKGGSIYGYEDKYLKISQKIFNEYGYTVVVASNPVICDTKTSFTCDMEFITKNFPHTSKIYAFGHSNGGIMLAAFAYKYPLIKRVLSVNAPLMVDFQLTRNGITNFKGEKMTLLYGDLDPSKPFLDKLKYFTTKGFSYEVLKDTDHHFTNKVHQFIELPFKYLF